jgi:4-hydroxy-tetrahydrodipicolinate synthase
MSQPTFQGSFVALVTPFRNGQVDEAKLRELVEFQISNGTDGLIPCGTTGESPTLSHDEHKRVVEIVVEAARKRVHVVAGTGTNSTREAIDLTKHAERAGASGALVVNPYYNKPTQEGLYQHFRAVAESVAIPIITYNIQGRTAVNVETATMARLARDVKNIVGVKEASGSLDQMSQVIAACGPNFCVLSGDDNITLPVMAIGGHGVISVIARRPTWCMPRSRGISSARASCITGCSPWRARRSSRRTRSPSRKRWPWPACSSRSSACRCAAWARPIAKLSAVSCGSTRSSSSRGRP